MKKKTNRRKKTVVQTNEQIALTCTSAVQAYRISDAVGREYLKLHMDEAIELGLVKEIPKEKKDVF